MQVAVQPIKRRYPAEVLHTSFPYHLTAAGTEAVIEAASMTEYRRAFEVNFWGPLQVVQAMTPLLRPSKGRIINLTSSSE